MPKGYKKHPVTGELIKAFVKVPPPLAPALDYNQLLQEYYDNIKHGVLINLQTFVESKNLTDGQKHYLIYDFIKTNHPDFWEKVLTLSRQHYHSNSVQVDASLLKKCMEGDPRAIKLYYERIEGWISQISQPVTNIQVIFASGMMSDDEQHQIRDLKKVDKEEIIDLQGEVNLLTNGDH